MLHIDPNSTDALYGKAGLETRHGNTQAAIRLWEQVPEIGPSQMKAGTSLVNAHFKLNGIEGSQQFLAQAEKRRPDQALIPMLQLLFDLNVTGDHESALAAAKRFTQLTPDPEGVEVYLAAFVRLKICDERAGVRLIHEFAKLSQRRSWARQGSSTN